MSQEGLCEQESAGATWAECVARSEESNIQEASLRVPTNKEGVPHIGKEGRTEGRDRGKGGEGRGETQRSGEREEGRQAEGETGEGGGGRPWEEWKGRAELGPSTAPTATLSSSDSCPWSCIWGLLRKHRASLSAELGLGLDLSPLCVRCTRGSQTYALRTPEQWLGAAQVWGLAGGIEEHPGRRCPCPSPARQGLQSQCTVPTEFLAQLCE